MLQRAAPYSSALTIPPESGAALLAEVISLNKVTVNEDSFGAIISLNDLAALEMRYYRNNILHTYILHSLVCRVLECHAKITTTSIVEQVQQLLLLIKTELFLWGSESDMVANIEASLNTLSELNIVQQDIDGNWLLLEANNLRSKSRILAECVDETIQRLAIICSLIERLAPLNKASFEEKVVSIAKRLSVLNNISAPEFIDKKAQSMLIGTMQKLEYITNNDEGQLIPTETLKPLKDIIINLTDIEVLQSIAR